MTGMVGCEHLTLIHQIEHFSGIVILTSRRSVGQLDLDRLPKLKYVERERGYYRGGREGGREDKK